MFSIKQVSILLLLFFISHSVFSQHDSTLSKHKKKKESIKKGWNFGGFPIISFNSDLGVQLGALAGLYNYGDGSRYPQYDHYLYFEGSFYTKGSNLFRLYYDSDQLIKKTRITADLTYILDHRYDFLGFNGYISVYNPQWIDDSTDIFYKVKKQMFRFLLNFQGNIHKEQIKWLAGFDFYHVTYDNVNVDKLNRNRDPEDKIPAIDSLPPLYEKYKRWGIIGKDEADGGWFTALKAGIIFDTRDNEPNPGKGLFSEIIFAGAPKFLSNLNTGYLKLSIIHRQYFSLIKNHLIFAYRLGFQFTLAGSAPWFVENILYPTYLRGSSTDGLGGDKTLRGIIRNRVVGDGISYGNFELRWKIWQTIMFRQNVYFAISGFFDTGRVLVKMKQDQIDNLPDDVKSIYFTDKESFHNSTGGAVHIAINENMMLTVVMGKALDKRDGNIGTYVGLGYLF